MNKAPFSVLLVFVLLSCGTACAQWVRTNGPYGGEITCMSSIGDHVFAGVGAGVYVSTDDGTSWYPTGLDIPQYALVYSLASIDSDIFAGTRSGIYRSTDLGLSWRRVIARLKFTTWLPDSEVYVLATDGKQLVAGGGAGVFMSTNLGATWSERDDGIPNTDVRALLITDYVWLAGSGQIGYQGNGMFRSTDQGKSWWGADTDQTAEAPVSAFATIGSALFAGNGGLVTLSLDSGQSWIEIDTNWQQFFASGLNSGVYSLAVMGTSLFAGMGNGVFRSIDSGRTWDRATAILPFTPMNCLTVNGSKLYAGSDEGVFLSLDSAATWKAVSSGLAVTSSIISLGTFNDNLFVSSYGFNDGAGVYRSSDLGGTWDAASGCLTTLTMTSFLPFDSLLIGTGWGGGVFVTSDLGRKWIDVSPNAGTAIVARQGTSLLASYFNAIYLSDDTGRSWKLITGGFHTWPVFWGFVVSDSNIFVGCDSTLYRSSDRGASWQIVVPNFKRQYGISYGSIFADHSVLYLQSGNALLCSTDEGEDWNSKSQNLSYKLFCAQDGHLFSASGDTLFISTDSGATWSGNDMMLGADNYITSLLISGSNIIVGTDSGVCFKRPIWQLLNAPPSLVDGHNVTKSLQFFPNPFSQSTAITFTPEVSGHVDVSVVNLLGIEVARLFSGDLGAGEHTTTWDASYAAPGMYECLVRMNGQVEKLPIMLLR